jgi:hypothetical protein
MGMLNSNTVHCSLSTALTMSLEHLQPFQVDPDRVSPEEIATLIDKISINSKVGEIHGLFDRNVSLCAYLLKHAYIDYQKIYFLSTSLILSEDSRPDYICGCYHRKKGMSWYSLICAGSQEQTWDDKLQLTTVAKLSFNKLNYCNRNLSRILVSNQLVDRVDPDCVQGLLIIGQDREFFRNRRKQERKRNMNQNSQIKVRTYGAFLRKFGNQKSQNWLTAKIEHLLDRSKTL